MVRGVRELGLETCATLGMLTPPQAARLKAAGLDYYNHNLDTSEAFYGEVITTRTYQDRLDTLAAVRDAGIHVCCGGILGMGETADDRVAFLHTLATLDPHPESVPVNNLVQVEGTPLAGSAPLDPIEFVRIIALARILMPRSHVRLSAGRSTMSDEMQALCFLAGANSIFYGEKLLTTGNPDTASDQALVRPPRHPARARRRDGLNHADRADRLRAAARGPRCARATPASPRRPAGRRRGRGHRTRRPSLHRFLQQRLSRAFHASATWSRRSPRPRACTAPARAPRT